MARRSDSHKIGDLGEVEVRRLFSKAGFAVSEMSRDYGEDLFIFGEDDEIIEPFKIYVQVKASGNEDKYKSDWTIYEDYLTVRNWVLGNDLTVLIRYNIKEGIYKYCIPEDEIEYWELPFKKGGKVPINCNKEFDLNSVKELMWIARIRHYDRVVKLTQPNGFGEDCWEGVPRYRLFCLEFLQRLQILGPSDNPLRNEIYLSLIHMSNTMLDEHEDSEDMSALDKARYAACFRYILAQLEHVSGYPIGMSHFFIDSCSCLLVQYMFQIENY